MGEAEIGRFLSALATDLHVSASTQNQALNALFFLYREILKKHRLREWCYPREAAAPVTGRVDAPRNQIDTRLSRWV